MSYYKSLGQMTDLSVLQTASFFPMGKKQRPISPLMIHLSALLFLGATLYGVYIMMELMPAFDAQVKMLSESMLYDPASALIQSQESMTSILLPLFVHLFLSIVLTIPFVVLFILSVYRCWASIARWKGLLSHEDRKKLLNPVNAALGLVVPFAHIFLHFPVVFGLEKVGATLARLRELPYRGPSRFLLLQFCWAGVATLVLSMIIMVIGMITPNSVLVTSVVDDLFIQGFMAWASFCIYLILLKLNDLIVSLNPEDS